MSRCFLSLIVLVSCASASGQQPPPSSAAEIVPITPDTVVATVNGRDFTAGELERITQGLNQQMRAMAGTRPKDFLAQYALSLTLAAEAEKAGVPGMSPWRERLEAATRQILVQGVLAEKGNQVAISDEEIRKRYEADRSAWRQATAKVIFISRVSYVQDLATGDTQVQKSEVAAEKAAKVLKLARDGGDFVALAKEYSDDAAGAAKGADFPFPVRAASRNVPAQIRDALLGAQPGDIVGPLEEDSGYYIFRVLSVETAPFEQARADIEKEIRQTAVSKWVEEMKRKSTVTLDHQAFWDTFIAANKQALEEQKKKTEQSVRGGK